MLIPLMLFCQLFRFPIRALKVTSCHPSHTPPRPASPCFPPLCSAKAEKHRQLPIGAQSATNSKSSSRGVLRLQRSQVGASPMRYHARSCPHTPLSVWDPRYGPLGPSGAPRMQSILAIVATLPSTGIWQQDDSPHLDRTHACCLPLSSFQPPTPPVSHPTEQPVGPQHPYLSSTAQGRQQGRRQRQDSSSTSTL